ncbi:MAG: hypothetical protein J6S12_02010 [Alphaproteobacteria bacterium]|nr:hypothetical protein [Alphaproteobacteria bacterium]
MDSTIIAAVIAAGSAMVINIVTNIILSSRQTALIEYRIKQLEDCLVEIKAIPERVTVLETKMSAVEEALKEMRLG